MTRVARPRPYGMVLVVVFLLGACDASGSGRDASGRGAVTRDSAGVTIVENTEVEPAGVARWSIDTTPSTTVGVSMGDAAYEFTSIGGVRRLPNGMIVVVNGQGELKYEFRFYDSTGRHIATHGRQGQGPGEYRWINFFGSVGGDTVIGVDFPNSRLNWVSASSGYLRSSRLDETRFRKLLGDDASGTIETMTPLGDSLYAVKAYRRILNATSIAQRGMSYHIVDMAANSRLDLVRYDEPPRKVLELSTGRTHLSPRGAGTAMHVVDRARRRICAANSSVSEISCIDSAGKRLSIRWRAETIPYTDDDRDAYETSLRSSRGSRRTEADINAMIAAAEWPEHHTPFMVLVNDTAGNFWILEHTLDSSGKRRARFRVFDPDGRHIAFADAFPLRSPSLSQLVHIGETSMLRVFEDADGVPIVGVFPIRKPD